jgi:hypothetical protein
MVVVIGLVVMKLLKLPGYNVGENQNQKPFKDEAGK